jgi:hypothetical protein
MVFDYLGSIYLIGKVRSVLQSDNPAMKKAINNNPLHNLSKLSCTFLTANFQGQIDMIVRSQTLGLHLSVQQTSMDWISKAVADYFNKRLSRCFYNYKAIKGFLGMIITSLYQYISVDELIHFDLPQSDSPFYR